MYVLKAVNEHLKPDQIIDNIIKLNYQYKFDRFGIETNFFKGMLERELQMAIENERASPLFKPFGVETFTASARHGEGKHARILSLQPYHERGDLLFPGDSIHNLKGALSELAFQMLEYTQAHRPIHDDLLDSLAYHTKLIRRGDEDISQQIPQNSIRAVFERDRQKIIARVKMLPRPLRRYPEPMFA
jgi:predicted phage terminase large subunit-like protein